MILMANGMPRTGDLVRVVSRGVWLVGRSDECLDPNELNYETDDPLALVTHAFENEKRWIQDGVERDPDFGGEWVIHWNGIYLGQTACKNINAESFGPVHWFHSEEYGPVYVQQNDVLKIDLIRRMVPLGQEVPGG